MRIRHYVFDLLAGTGNSVVKLPSNREIARKFGVSQPTVVKALQGPHTAWDRSGNGHAGKP